MFMELVLKYKSVKFSYLCLSNPPVCINANLFQNGTTRGCIPWRVVLCVVHQTFISVKQKQNNYLCKCKTFGIVHSLKLVLKNQIILFVFSSDTGHNSPPKINERDEFEIGKSAITLNFCMAFVLTMETLHHDRKSKMFLLQLTENVL